MPCWGKGENIAVKSIPPAKGALQSAQHLEEAGGLDPDWVDASVGKALVPTGRRGQGSSDKDWKTLGMSFSLPQPSWCFLKLVKGAHTPRIQGIAQKEEAVSVGCLQAGSGDAG